MTPGRRSHPVDGQSCAQAVAEAWAQCRRLETSGCGYRRPQELAEALRNRQLCFAHAVYLEAILFALRSGVGSRGSAIVAGTKRAQASRQAGRRVAHRAGGYSAFGKRCWSTVATPAGEVEKPWVDRRPLPQTDAWFETAWASFRSGDVYE